MRQICSFSCVYPGWTRNGCPAGTSAGMAESSPTARYYWPSATLREFVAILAEHPVLNGTICLALVVLGVLVGLDR